jgi:SAM-dependent methyltransferase
MRAKEFKFDIDQQSVITPELMKQHKQSETEGTDKSDLSERILDLMLILQMTQQSFIKKEPTGQIVDQLVLRLHELRNRCSPDTWQHLLPVAQSHPVAEFLLTDPFTRWSFQKPRGYSGDAGLLDLLYKHPSIKHLIDESSPLGQEIYAYTSDSSSCVAVRERRMILAELVDATATKVDNPEILAVACGHLREAELSQSYADGKLKRWVALDQDTQSLATVAANHVGTAIDAMAGSVAGLIRRSYALGQFDLAYAAGLYDYLPKHVSIRLNQRLMELVKPGGEFLFANFSTEVVPDGYMETFMNWPLILRSEQDMWDIVNGSVDRNHVEAEVFFGENRHIIYAKIKKLS